MSRKLREIKKVFKIFCEGDSEYNYFDSMKRERKLSLAIKLVNMKGGGYGNFLEKIREDGNTNCLAKFIIIDGDRAFADEAEKAKLKEMLDYCMLQNKNNRIAHIVIVNFPNFEYVACLHTMKYQGQNDEQYITRELKYKDLADFKADSQLYNVLNSKGNSCDLMIQKINQSTKLIENDISVNRSNYEIKVKTVCNWNNLGKKGTNINDFFETVEKMIGA